MSRKITPKDIKAGVRTTRRSGGDRTPRPKIIRKYLVSEEQYELIGTDIVDDYSEKVTPKITSNVNFILGNTSLD